MVNTGAASRLEYVQAIINAAGLKIRVQATSASSFNRIAQVSNNESALNIPHNGFIHPITKREKNNRDSLPEDRKNQNGVVRFCIMY